MTDTEINARARNAIAVDDIKSAREELLASDAFKKSPRMSRLLDYLVEKAILESARDTSEYAIGIEVFDRNPRLYSTGDDPVVRVQVGRLRAKLKNYYASLGCDAAVEIVIPLGCYMPAFQCRRRSANDFQHTSAFSICPFKCVSQHAEWEWFTQGLHDELTHHLYKNLGRKIIIESPPDLYKDKPAGKPSALFPGEIIGHRLEGSVHVDAERIRTSVRLIDVATGCLEWSEQFNRAAPVAVAHQQELASSICHALRSFVSMGQACFSITQAHPMPTGHGTRLRQQ